MNDALFWHRLQFAFTITYHYLFPQLTMGLALLIVILKVQAYRTGSARYANAARFWARIFGLTFAVGVVTGIPLEFQFGTNWARFSKFSGGVIGQTLAMEGMFAFFLESTTLGLFLYAEKRIGEKAHLAVAILLWLGAWLSGYFIIATNAFMQHPVGFVVAHDGTLQLADFWAFVLNRLALWEYLHNMCAAVVTGAFVVSATAAYWALSGEHERQATLNLRIGTTAALIARVLQIFPTGDWQGRMVATTSP
ncbi:MAG: cytochrome ubiquinol oxidase subunit I [Polyangia bacterium]